MQLETSRKDLLKQMAGAITAYCRDGELSRPDDYDLEALVAIPRDEPVGCDPDAPISRAWQIKSSVMVYERAFGKLPIEGRRLLRAFLAEADAAESGFAVYTAADTFRCWVLEQVELADFGNHETDNIFARSGRTWQLTYSGKTVHVPDSVGLGHIAQLLSKPNKDFEAAYLMAIRSGPKQVIAAGSSGEVLDEQACREYRDRIRELEFKIDEAKSNKDLESIEPLHEEKEQLLAELKRATGLGGRPRMKTDFEKFRRAVSNAISRAIESLRLEHEDLARHPHLSISLGSVLRYAPESPITWIS